MNHDALFNLTFAGVIAALGGLLIWLCREPEPTEEERAARVHEQAGIEVWDDTAGCWLTLAPGVKPAECQYTAHEVAVLDRLVLAWQADAFDPDTDPQWATARARLLTDLNDQQGEQL